MLKRCFDVVIAATALVLLSPVYLTVAILISIGSPGPILYRGRRAGRGATPFLLLKFRTMVVNAEKIGGPSTSEDDPRVTPIGRWLRKYKLDELPQMLNVLKGQMSLVGPRPEVLSEVERYNAEERQLLTVLPGITDWSSICFHNEGEILRGAADPHQAYLELIRPEKIRLGLKYVRERSFRTDLQIIAATFATLVRTRAGKPALSSRQTV